MKRRDFLQYSYKMSLATALYLHFPLSAFAQNRLTLWGAPALISLPLAVAFKNGEAKRALDYDFKLWKTPDQLRAGFASGDFLLSAAPSNVGVVMANAGMDVKMLNILTNGLNYLFSRDENLKNLKDLEGKNIIIPFKNDLPDIIFQSLCKKHNVDLSKVNIHYVQTPSQAVQLFVAKSEFYAILSQEPMASAMTLLAKKNALATYRNIDIQALWGETFGQVSKIPQAGLIVKGSFYESNKEFFALLQTDLQNALRWIMSNKDSAAKIGSSYLPAKEVAIKLAIDYANLVVEPCRQIQEELLSFYEIIFELNPKLLGGKLPDKSLFL